VRRCWTCRREGAMRSSLGPMVLRRLTWLPHTLPARVIRFPRRACCGQGSRDILLRLILACW
jgi:hypothetical protein